MRIRTKKNKSENIIKIQQNGQEYIVWTHADVVRDFVKEDLKRRYSGKLIVRELNQIDLSIPDENLPIEIQSTIVKVKIDQEDIYTIQFAAWENLIRRQIDQDIIYGKCILYFDSEFLEP